VFRPKCERCQAGGSTSARLRLNPVGQSRRSSILIDALCKAKRGDRIFNIDARMAFSIRQVARLFVRGGNCVAGCRGAPQIRSAGRSCVRYPVKPQCFKVLPRLRFELHNSFRLPPLFPGLISSSWARVARSLARRGWEG